MIPSGVVRIITAASPSEPVRDAMLGDFAEEYQLRAQRDGDAAARRWCWTHALRSLADTLRHSFPSAGTLLTNVAPAIMWGYFIGVLLTLAAFLLSAPIAVMLSGTWTLGTARSFELVDRLVLMRIMLIAMNVPTGIIMGFETARVGRKAPLWSALLLGVCLIAATFTSFAIRPTSLLVSQQWYLAAALLPALPTILIGAVLQQSMWYRFGFSKPPTTA